MPKDKSDYLKKPARLIADKEELEATQVGAATIDAVSQFVRYRAMLVTAQELGLTGEKIVELTDFLEGQPDHATILMINRLLEKFVLGSRLEVALKTKERQMRDIFMYVESGIEGKRWKYARQAFYGEKCITYLERRTIKIDNLKYSSAHKYYKDEKARRSNLAKKRKMGTEK